jgi:hypothetical protein
MFRHTKCATNSAASGPSELHRAPRRGPLGRIASRYRGGRASSRRGGSWEKLDAGDSQGAVVSADVEAAEPDVAGVDLESPRAITC